MARASSGSRLTNKASVRNTSLTRGRGSAVRRFEAQTNGGAEPLVVYFDDIQLVRDLLGDYDANLAVLEDRLGVEATVNGNAVALRGPDAACAAAKSVLEQLYARLAEGEMISAGDVAGAIRHAIQTDNEANVKAPAAQIRTRKRLITARTPAQSAYLESLQRTSPRARRHRAPTSNRSSATTWCSPPALPVPARHILRWRSQPRAWKRGAAIG
jgi:hypothetical protein